MKKVALVFVVAVLAPSLVLAWLAVRSLRDQQFLIERQQSLIDQRFTDSMAQGIADYLARAQQDFAAQVESLAAGADAQAVAMKFDDQLRQRWPLAEVGFCVTAAGKLLSPSAAGRPAAQSFRVDNGGFLGNQEPAEVYLANNSQVNAAQNQVAAPSGSSSDSLLNTWAHPALRTARTATPTGLAGDRQTKDLRVEPPEAGSASGSPADERNSTSANGPYAPDSPGRSPYQNALNYKTAQTRNVSPQSQQYSMGQKAKEETAPAPAQDNLSRAVPAEAEFRQLMGDQTDGMLARFLQNKLNLMCWHRLAARPDLIFGAQLSLDRITEGIRDLVQHGPASREGICLAVLDDNAKPVAVSVPKFQANWKRPFVASEVGDALPHWEVAAYLVDPAQLTVAARTTRLTLGLLIGVLVVAIGVGSLLIVRSLNAELKLARQKTDFVSNVSHELKTPLTSIRMFSELLADGRVTDRAKQRSYLEIISAEAGRLTRLINNVLDFSRLERGEKKYNFQAGNLTTIVQSAAETFRPHLESAGIRFIVELPARAIAVRGDADALAQVIVNLLSNAEKYAPDGKEIALHLTTRETPVPFAEIKVLDRGPGVPRGSEEKIFEKFYRAHDSLSSGVQGSGLGLTIARQIARAHGGEVTYEPRDGGGACFSVRLPLAIA